MGEAGGAGAANARESSQLAFVTELGANSDNGIVDDDKGDDSPIGDEDGRGDGTASVKRSSLTCADRRSEVQRQAVVALAIMSRQPGRPLNGRLDATPAPAPTSPQGQQRGGSCWRTRAVASLAAVASDWSDASTARQAADVLVNAGVWSRGEVLRGGPCDGGPRNRQGQENC